jgi:molecular chaperone GrpE
VTDVPGSEPTAGETDDDVVPEDDFAAEMAALIGEDVVVGDISGAAAEVVDEQAGYASCEEALEDAVTSLERVTAERDEYLELARRVQAEFANYRKRVDAQRSEQIARAAESLVVELLPVLDACDAAIAHGAADVEPILASLSSTLVKQGLAKDESVEVTFDPNQHEAVLSEPGEGGDDGPVVAEILRAGYHWNGRVLRPAMVKVRG